MQKAQMYVTRHAVQKWQRKCSESMPELGFVLGKVPPCPFFHLGWKVCGLMHGDDFVLVGIKGQLSKIADHMKNKFNVKVAVAGTEDAEPARVLNQSQRGPGVRKRPKARRQTRRGYQAVHGSGGHHAHHQRITKGPQEG